MNTINIETSSFASFPSEIASLLKTLDANGFFDDSMLVGSWVMVVYKAALGIDYDLRTGDIDFAVTISRRGHSERADLDKIFTGLGYSPAIMGSGIVKYSGKGYSIDFIIQRKGGSETSVVPVIQWNVTAEPLPFLDILLGFPQRANFGEFSIRVPIPEAYFIHKLIVAPKRPSTTDRDKDFNQCAVIIPHLDKERLITVMKTQKFSAQYKKYSSPPVIGSDFRHTCLVSSYL